MRNAFAREITAMAADDPRLVLLSGDIGNRLFDEYKKRFPERFFNCGVAEANMTGMAAGMALCGLRPITYTIATFNTNRCHEQIRIDVCYHNLPVIIVGIGAGLSYAGLGGTHQALEDIALLRILPNMTVICPGDTIEVSLALRAAFQLNSPVYLRLGKKNEPVVHKTNPDFTVGKGIILRQGEDVSILSTGNMLPIAMETAEILAGDNVSAQVISMHTVKPLDHDLLQTVFQKARVVASIEEHTVVGGLGAAIAEWLSRQPSVKGRLIINGIEDTFLHNVGGQSNARKVAHLVPGELAEKIRKTLLGCA